ncbi:MAG: hypothetical protein GXY68_03070 [Chloroflexi bacterium]|jgi:hypothetical protein|nr:hypothetical protein [Chloroflexota bacterium]
MSEKLAKLMLAEIPTDQLKQIVAGMETLPQRSAATSGGFCGLDCPGSDGSICGLDCHNVTRSTVGVVDRANVAGITRAELDAARSKSVAFKDTLLTQARILGKVL